jgi:hypothetical protein
MAGLGAVLLAAGTVRAQDDEGGAPNKKQPRKQRERRGVVEMMDENKDGQVTMEEFKSFNNKALEQRFKKLDINGDGVITAEDKPVRKPRPERVRGQKNKRMKVPPAPEEGDEPAPVL